MTAPKEVANEKTCHLFLQELQEKETPVSIYLRSGIKLTGKIVGFTDSQIYLKNIVTQQVYKHAICTILPGWPGHG